MNPTPEELYRKGLVAFNDGDYYAAHDYWEDLWSDHKLDDSNFIQGLIQLAVGCFHIGNKNINGSRGLFTKCRPKLEAYSPYHRDVDVAALLDFVDASLKQLDSIDHADEFRWQGVPKLKLPLEKLG